MILLNLCHQCFQRVLINSHTLIANCNRVNYRPLSVLFYGSDEFSLETLKLLTKDYNLKGSTNYGDNYKDDRLITRLDVVISSDQNVIARYAKHNRISGHRFPYDVPRDVYDIGIVSSFGHLIPGRAINACRLGIHLLVVKWLLSILFGFRYGQHSRLTIAPMAGCGSSQLYCTIWWSGDRMYDNEISGQKVRCRRYCYAVWAL